MTTIITQSWCEANRREDPSLRKSAEEFGDSSEGSFRFFSALSKIFRLANFTLKEQGMRASETLQKAEKNFGTAAGAFAIPQVYFSTTRAVKAAEAAGKADSSQRGFTRKVTKAFKEVTSAISTYGHATCFFVYNPAIASLAKATDLSSGLFEVGMNVDDYTKAAAMARQITKDTTKEVKDAIANTTHYIMLRTSAKVTGIAGTVIAMLSKAFAITLVPASVLLVMAVVAALLSIAAPIHKGSLPHNLIDFYKFDKLDAAPAA